MKFFILFASLIALSSAAKYDGKGAADARRILNNSQGAVPYGWTAEGHPRGHALGWDSSANSINSVQDYSRSGTGSKTGFQSIWDQDELVHRALSHKLCQDEIAKLNDNKKPSKRESCEVPIAQISPENVMIQEWNDGKSTRCGYMRKMTLVLGHFKNENKNANYDVHIHTAYPKFT